MDMVRAVIMEVDIHHGHDDRYIDDYGNGSDTHMDMDIDIDAHVR